MIQQTSIEAWRTIQPSLNARQQKVLIIFKTNPSLTHTDKELAVLLHWPINCVTNRRGELAKKGLIEKVGIRRCPITKKRNTAWRLAKHD